MSAPELEERKSFWIWCYARETFGSAIEACRLLEKPKPTISAGAVQVLISGLIVTYGKPFTRSRGVGGLEASLVPSEYRKLHGALMDLRHKAIAHMDAEDFQADDPAIGNMNQIRLNVFRGGFNLSVLRPAASQLPFAEVRKLCEKLRVKADYHMNKFSRKYLQKHNLPLGSYRVNLDAREPRPFVPVSPLPKTWRAFPNS